MKLLRPPDNGWRWSQDVLRSKIKTGEIIFSEDETRIIRKIYLANQQGRTPENLWDGEKYGTTRLANSQIKELFQGKTVFDTPKPIQLIYAMMKLFYQEKDYIILDFFAGSAPTAHAVLELNKEDGGNRKFIMVQLPEPCDEKSEAFKTGYKTIADIGKERIRRVIKKIEEERAAKAKEAADALPGMAEEMPELDLGFKVLKLDRSNFKPWERLDADASEEEIATAIQQHLFHIDPEASQEDILYEILLKAGFMPTEKVEKLDLAGKTVFSIAEGALLICLEDEITRELIDAVAEAEPMQFICLDQGFKGNDQLKTNAVQTFAARNQGRDKAGQIVFRTV